MVRVYVELWRVEINMNILCAVVKYEYNGWVLRTLNMSRGGSFHDIKISMNEHKHRKCMSMIRFYSSF